MFTCNEPMIPNLCLTIVLCHICNIYVKSLKVGHAWYICQRNRQTPHENNFRLLFNHDSLHCRFSSFAFHHLYASIASKLFISINKLKLLWLHFWQSNATSQSNESNYCTFQRFCCVCRTDAASKSSSSKSI